MYKNFTKQLRLINLGLGEVPTPAAYQNGFYST